jgi:hypothetical protein
LNDYGRINGPGCLHHTIGGRRAYDIHGRECELVLFGQLKDGLYIITGNDTGRDMIKNSI